MDNLKQVVLAAMKDYARKGLNSESYLTQDESGTVLSVVTIPQGKGNPFLSLLVRIVGERIIIDRDQNDRPLVNALIQAGIAREQIVLAYAGESVHQTV